MVIDNAEVAVRASALTAAASVVCAVVALGLSLITYMDISMYGFPDGHITDYQEAARTPLTVIAWVEVGFGLLFLAIALSPIGTRARTFAWLAALIGFALVATAAHFGVPWYFGTQLGLDNGIGG